MNPGPPAVLRPVRRKRALPTPHSTQDFSMSTLTSSGLSWLAGLAGALFLASAAMAAPPSSQCKAPELAKRDLKGVKVGDWKALAAKAGSDGAGATEEAAIASVCKYRGCDTRSAVICDTDDGTTCYVKDAAGVLFAFSGVFEVYEGGLEVGTSTSPDGRWLHVGLVHEVLGRIEDAMCEEDEDGNMECMSATGSHGWEYANLVIDTKAMTLVFDGRVSDYDESASGKQRCKGKPDLSFAGDSFVYQGCDGKKVTVGLADLSACTVAARTAWSEAVAREADAAEQKKNSAAMAVADKKVDEGRKATKAKKYAEAIAAFDAALEAWPYLPKAYSGRGYARLLRGESGDLEAAKRDFQRALEEETGDMKFRAAVHFNLGLLAEKQKKPEEAKAWFRKSHGQNPTDATKKKLGL
jgi:tetratricopeptide (TPR) repeat protein